MFKETDERIARWLVRRLIGGQDMMVFERRLTKVDRERINEYVKGGYHFVRRNHGKRKKFTPQELEMEKGAAQASPESIKQLEAMQEYPQCLGQAEYRFPDPVSFPDPLPEKTGKVEFFIDGQKINPEGKD